MYANILTTLQTDILEAGCSEFDAECRLEGVKKYPFARLYCFLDGHARMEHSHHSFSLEPGFLYLVPAYAEVAWHNQGGFRTYWCLFNVTVLAGVDLLDCVRLPLEVRIEEPDLILDCFGYLVRSLNASTQNNNLQTEGLLKVLLAPFTKAPSPDQNKLVNGQEILRFQPALKYIQKNLCDKLSVADLAAIVSLEPKHFSKKFKKVFGLSPYAFVMQQRVRIAQHRLLKTEDTLDEIAAETGFSDGFHLSKVFSRISGISPKAFRNKEYDIEE